MVEAAKAKRQHVFHGERVQAFSDAVFAIVATFAVRHLNEDRIRVEWKLIIQSISLSLSLSL